MLILNYCSQDTKKIYLIFLKDSKLKNLDFNELMNSLVTLSQPINIFFEKVQINDKNILLKTNRLYLLFNIKNYVVREIDFSKIIKGKEL